MHMMSKKKPEAQTGVNQSHKSSSGDDETEPAAQHFSPATAATEPVASPDTSETYLLLVRTKKFQGCL